MDAVQEAKRWFSVRKGIERRSTIALQSGMVEYPLPDDCDAVIDCSIQTSPLDIAQAFAPNVAADERIPYGLYASAGASGGGMYSTILQTLQYNEMAKRILGADFNWAIMPENKIAFYPTPKSSAVVLVEYKAAVNSLSVLSERDHDLVKKYSLAWAKDMLGTIRSKYDSMPSAQGSVHLNGRELKEEAKAEMEKLDETILHTTMLMPIITG